MQTHFKVIPSPLTFEPVNEFKCGKTLRRERRKKHRK